MDFASDPDYSPDAGVSGMNRGGQGARTMSAPRVTTKAALAPRFALGVATGLLVGILTAILPVIVVGAVAVIAVVLVVRLIVRAGVDATVMLAGTLLGAGIVYAYGVYHTVQACAQTTDFCGDANVTPLAIVAALAIAGGITGAIAARMVSPRSAS